jgi:hypothetical protein
MFEVRLLFKNLNIPESGIQVQGGFSARRLVVGSDHLGQGLLGSPVTGNDLLIAFASITFV